MFTGTKMNKHEKKQIKLIAKADACTSREEAVKLILKAEKLRAKLLAKKLLSDAN
jgi:hypothetical protein